MNHLFVYKFNILAVTKHIDMAKKQEKITHENNAYQQRLKKMFSPYLYSTDRVLKNANVWFLAIDNITSVFG